MLNSWINNYDYYTLYIIITLIITTQTVLMSFGGFNKTMWPINNSASVASERKKKYS